MHLLHINISVLNHHPKHLDIKTIKTILSTNETFLNLFGYQLLRFIIYIVK